jgi:hypothetical protein
MEVDEQSGSIRTWSSSARGAGPRAVEALPESALKLIGTHGIGRIPMAADDASGAA